MSSEKMGDGIWRWERGDRELREIQIEDRGLRLAILLEPGFMGFEGIGGIR